MSPEETKALIALYQQQLADAVHEANILRVRLGTTQRQLNELTAPDEATQPDTAAD